MSRIAYTQHAILRTAGDGWRAEAWIRQVELGEDEQPCESHTHSESQAWRACETALEAMAKECLRQAAICRGRSIRSEVQHELA